MTSIPTTPDLRARQRLPGESPCYFVNGQDGWTNCPVHLWTGFKDQRSRVLVCPAAATAARTPAVAETLDVTTLREAIEGLRKDHGAQSRIGILGPDGHAGAWAALGAVLAFLNGRPIAPPPFDPSEASADPETT